MIRLFVDNTELNLPKNTEFEFIDTNPLITETGEYSLDINVSLLEPRNAIAFNHINRLNNNDIQTKYNAQLIIDLKTRTGIATVLSHTENSVTFQILLGNADMNFSIENNKKIWELDWGVESPIDFNKALQTIKKSTWEPDGFNFVCAPIKAGGMILNDYLIEDGASWNTPARIYDIKDTTMQPYILYYINKLPELLGFSLENNVLNDDDRAKNMYIVNSVQSLHYAHALPDMTISEFVTEIENFFNVRFIVNKQNREMSIVRLKEDIQRKKTIKLKNVTDSYERIIENTEERKARFGFTKIGYDLNISGWNRYAKLSEEVIKKSEIRNFETQSQLVSNFFLESDKGRYIFYRNLSELQDFIFTDEPNERIFFLLVRKTPSTLFDTKIHHVNKLADRGDDDSHALVLKLIPAQIVGEIKNVAFTEGQGADQKSEFPYQLPVSSNSASVFSEQNLLEVIQDGEKTIPRTSNIEVSLFCGMIPTLNLSTTYTELLNGILYPFSCIDYYPEYGTKFYSSNHQNDFTYFLNWVRNSFTPNVPGSMRLVGDTNFVDNYSIISFLDMSKEYVFEIKDDVDLDADNIFEYNGLNYMPIQFERRIKNSGMKNNVIGSFYRIVKSI